MELLRIPSNAEKQLIAFLLMQGNTAIKLPVLEHLMVRNMNDSGSGSLLLFPEGISEKDTRDFGSEISDVQFKDQDGIEVCATLTTDTNGALFELDIWKADFGNLIEIPFLV